MATSTITTYRLSALFLLACIVQQGNAFQPLLKPLRVHHVLPISIRTHTTKLYHANNPQSTSTSNSTFAMKVTHQNKTATLQINENESILQALERSKIHDQLALPSLPHECRRGNCLTCSGRLLLGSNQVQIRNDGLAPTMQKTIQEKGVVPTCTSFVTGDGVHLELGVCDDVWRDIWDVKDEEGERIRNDAVARTMRLSDEKNLDKWVEKTEKMLNLD